MPNHTVEEIEREYYARPLRPAAAAATAAPRVSPFETRFQTGLADRTFAEADRIGQQLDSAAAAVASGNDTVAAQSKSAALARAVRFRSQYGDTIANQLGVPEVSAGPAGPAPDTSPFARLGFPGAADRVGGEESENVSQRPVSVRGVVEGAADLAREYPVATTVGGVAAARGVLLAVARIGRTITTMPTAASLAAASPWLAALAPRLGRAFTPLGLAALEGEALYRALPMAVEEMEAVQGKPRGSTGEAYRRAIDSLIRSGGAGIGRLMGGGR